MPDETPGLPDDDIDENDFDEEFDEDFDIGPDEDLLAFERQLETDAGLDAVSDDVGEDGVVPGFEDDEDA